MCLERAGLLRVVEATELRSEINAEKGSSPHAAALSLGTLPILTRMSSLSSSVTDTYCPLVVTDTHCPRVVTDTHCPLVAMIRLAL